MFFGLIWLVLGLLTGVYVSYDPHTKKFDFHISSWQVSSFTIFLTWLLVIAFFPFVFLYTLAERLDDKEFAKRKKKIEQTNKKYELS